MCRSGTAVRRNERETKRRRNKNGETGVNPQVEMEQRALWRALDGASERLLRASEDMALSELHGLRTELEALARQALQTPAAVPGGTSAVTGKTSATTENPIAVTGISIAATGKPGAAIETALRPSNHRALALAKAAVALRSTFPRSSPPSPKPRRGRCRRACPTAARPSPWRTSTPQRTPTAGAARPKNSCATSPRTP